ncbi:MAG: STAS/SEC14 domain-containing protein [Flavobacteriia bacterium]|jgi:hypothetical protein
MNDNFIEFSRNENGIVIAMFNVVHIDVDKARELIKRRNEFTNHQPFRTLIDVTKVKGISKEARDVFGSAEGTKNVERAAFITNSPLSAFLANFLIKVNLTKAKSNVRLFTNKENAMQWLIES